jgi:hypothetical protein
MADVSGLDFAVVRVRGRAGKHAEALLEGGYLAAGDVVDVETSVIDELALRTTVSDLLYESACYSLLLLSHHNGTYLWYTDVGAVLSLEEHNSSPVVRLVLVEAASRALGELGEVVCWVHGDVKSVTSNNLMKMGSVLLARVDERICSLNNQLRASESQHVPLRGDIAGKSRNGSEEGSPLHRD